MGEKHQAEPLDNFRNQLKLLRTQHNLSQGELAQRAGITRQAVSSIESHLYLPTTAVALRLAAVLSCTVEDLFCLAESADVIDGVFVGGDVPRDLDTHPLRVKVTSVGTRTIIRPVNALGDVLSYTVPADGYLIEQKSGRARVKLSRDRHAVAQEIAVAGCDPAIFLAGEHLRKRKDRTTVVGWTMGSMAALHALQRGHVHVAGLHLVDPVTGESNLPFLRRMLKGSAYQVITFASWEEGFLVRPGNPKSIRRATDLANPSVTLINREEGAGARLLLDQRLRTAGLDATGIRGYDRVVRSHFDVARSIAEHQADVGVGIRSAAQLYDLDFVPLQSARYDLVVPKAYLKSHPTLPHLFDTINSRPFRTEIGALGGYDTRETGYIRAL